MARSNDGYCLIAQTSERGCEVTRLSSHSITEADRLNVAYGKSLLAPHARHSAMSEVCLRVYQLSSRRIFCSIKTGNRSWADSSSKQGEESGCLPRPIPRQAEMCLL